MRYTPLYICLFLLGWAITAHAQTSASFQAALPVIPPLASNTVAPKPTASDSAGQSELINQFLAVFSEAVITRLDARVSLQSLTVEKGRVRLDGLSLKNLDIGL